MSGTVLSSLCGICHNEPPKYKCPRCGARTCSVPCIQKHKARADCDGVRNPRAFMPLSQLKTPAGIDHDYNFLTSIERARQRVEKDVVEARRLLSEKDLRPRNEDKLFQKVWHGDELRHVPVQSHPYRTHKRLREGPAFIDGFDKHVRRRLQYLDIEVLTMPKGMARQRDNRTAFNRRTGTINWQIEWLVYSASQLGLPVEQSQSPLRILYKSLDGTPLHAALKSTLDRHRGQLDRQSREQRDQLEIDNEADADNSPVSQKKRKTHHNHYNIKRKHPDPIPPATQDPSTSTWPAAAYSTQYPLTSAWSQTTTAPHIETTLEEQLTSWQFFLHYIARPTTTTDSKKPKNAKLLIPVSSTETLASALAGRTVIEFPSIYAFPSGAQLPDGFEVGDVPRRSPRTRVVEAAMGGDDAFNNDNGVTRKREYSSWDGPGRGHGRGRGRGAAYGRGGKRVRFEAGRAPAKEEVEDGEESEVAEGEVEDGEVNNDGNEIMAKAEFGGVVMEGDVETGSVAEDGSSVTLTEEEEEEEEEEGEIVETKGARPTGGLVDYGSSDDS
ncbi:hypothetical protein N657DRAFT_646538, partial [Parathielavia appendiculata]